MKLLAYSKALYSTWLYYSPDRLLFDCGEGVSSQLGNKAFAVRRVFLSHGHTDHVAGLLGLVNIRNSAMGDTEKPLTVYYPRGNRRVEGLRDYLGRAHRRLKYELSWQGLEPGERVPLFEGQLDRYIEAFPTRHSQDPSLGYNVIERRWRLKAEYRDLPQEEIRRRVGVQGRESLSETYPQKLFSYGGDSVPLDPALVEGAEVLCHDATFLVEGDRDEYTHATLREAVQVAHAAGVKRQLLAIHISSRYARRLKEIAEEIAAWELPFEVILVPPGRLYRQP